MSTQAASAAGVAALLSSFGSICCIPIVAASLGAGGATLAAFFAPFRSFLIVAVLLLLAYAFFSVYRKPVCEDACRKQKSQRRLVWMMAVVTILILSAQWWSSWLIYWLL